MCDHRPRCPASTPTWICGKRTEIEQAVADQLVTELEAKRLLSHYGVPMTSAKQAVYTGQAKKAEKLW